MESLYSIILNFELKNFKLEFHAALLLYICM